MRIFLIAAMCLLSTSAALGKDVRIGPATVTLTPPPGQCELQAEQPSDARMVKAIEGMLAGKNQLLGAYADCQQLVDWRAGKRPLLDDMAQYQTLLSMIDEALPMSPQEAVKQICASSRSEGDKMLQGMMGDIKSRVESVMVQVKVNEMRFLGVVAEDPTACYAAMLQKFHTEVGTDKTQVTVFATMIIKGKIVYYYLFSPYADADTVTGMLEKHKRNVAALLAAN